MTLGQLNISGEIYHIRMDHQPPSHFLSLNHPHALSDANLNEHDYINKSDSPSSYTIANHRTANASLQETSQSDIRSMSVDPGSLDDQPASQGSSEGVGIGRIMGVEPAKKSGEFSGGVESSELVVGASSSQLVGALGPPHKANVSVC